MIFSQEISVFLNEKAERLLIDVRSEGEFLQGHITHAVNIPLLNNEERAIVGTIYKQKGNQDAVHKGFELVGGKFSDYISKAKELAGKRGIAVYCWRGGMRSNIMAWLFNMAGMQVNLLKGGYKNYRSTVLGSFDEHRNYLILGGKTGSGKTEMLQHLKQRGEQVIDLEGLANHRGSAFGGIGMQPQPSNEQFENDIYTDLCQMKSDTHIWLENESRLIGRNKIPDAIYAQMRTAPVVQMQVPIDLRIKRILLEYGAFDKLILEETTRKIEKKLGNLRMKQAIEALHTNQMEIWAKMMLDYYDDFYAFGMAQREPDSIVNIEITADSYTVQANTISAAAKLILKQD